MTITKAIRTTTALLGAGAMLLLASCSNSTPSDRNGAPADTVEQGVFEFQTPRYGSDSGELLIRLPEGLLDAATDREALVTGVALTAHELSGAKYCAVDAVPSYASGAWPVLKAPFKSADDKAAEASERYESLETWETVEPEVVSLFMDGTIGTVEKAQEYIAGGGQYADWVQGVLEDVGVGDTSTTPAWGLLMYAEPAAKLDGADPEPGTYVTDDGEFTFVTKCAASPADDGSFGLTLPARTDDGQISTFATVDFSVMKSGTITVTEAKTSGFVRDADGNWIIN